MNAFDDSLQHSTSRRECRTLLMTHGTGLRLPPTLGSTGLWLISLALCAMSTTKSCLGCNLKAVHFGAICQKVKNISTVQQAAQCGNCLDDVNLTAGRLQPCLEPCFSEDCHQGLGSQGPWTQVFPGCALW